jgi:hypothetical protein
MKGAGPFFDILRLYVFKFTWRQMRENVLAGADFPGSGYIFESVGIPTAVMAQWGRQVGL